jgi:hypothetical protein
MTTLHADRAHTRRAASNPSITGIRMSSSSTSGVCRSTAATASAPSPASATTSMSGCA